MSHGPRPVALAVPARQALSAATGEGMSGAASSPATTKIKGSNCMGAFLTEGGCRKQPENSLAREARYERSEFE